MDAGDGTAGVDLSGRLSLWRGMCICACDRLGWMVVQRFPRIEEGLLLAAVRTGILAGRFQIEGGQGRGEEVLKPTKRQVATYEQSRSIRV